jgi:transcriptional regulator with XRE-family HTH domain
MKINKGETYGSFVKRVRLGAKLTQMEMALRIGVNPTTISRWENGAKIPHYSQRRIDEFAKTIK